MRKLATILILLVSVTNVLGNTTVSVAHNTGPVYDVKAFEIAGIKLGMAAAEVIITLNRQYAASENELNIVKHDGRVLGIKYKQKDFAFHSSFTRIGGADGADIDVASRLIFYSPNGDPEKILRESKETFGEPSIVSAFQSKNTFFWCTAKSTKYEKTYCDKDKAVLVLDDGRRLKLETSEFTRLSLVHEDKRRLANKIPVEPFDPKKLYSHPENQRALPGESTQSVSGAENCPVLWSNFLDWYSRVQVLGDDIKEGDEEWFKENGYQTSFLINPSSGDSRYQEFYQLHIKPAHDIDEILEMAVVCDGDKDHPYPTRFVVAQYIDASGELGKFMLKPTKRGDHFAVSFFASSDDPFIEHAIKFNFFAPMPENFEALITQTSEKLRREK